MTKEETISTQETDRAFEDLMCAALGGEGDERELEGRYLSLAGKTGLSEQEQYLLESCRRKGDDPYEVDAF